MKPLTLSFLIFCCQAWSLQAAERSVLLSISAPDLEQMCKSFKENTIGSIVFSNELSAFRHFLDDLLAENTPELDQFMKTVIGAKLEVVTGNKDIPIGLRFKLNGDFLSLPDVLKQSFKRSLPHEAEISFTKTHLLCAINHELSDFEVPNTGSQIEAHWDLTALAHVAPADEKPFVKASLNFVPRGQLHMNVSADSLDNKIILTEKPAGLQAIDTKLLGRLPADAAFFAVGMHGGDWWKAHAQDVYTIAAYNTMGRRANAESIEMLKQQVNGIAQMLLGSDLDTFMSSINGTFMVVLNEPILMYPNISLLIPRSELLDNLVTRLFAMGQQAMPNEGSFTFLSLKNLGPNRGMLTPGAICVGKDQGHWIISMDSLFTEGFLKQKGGNINDRHYAKHLDNPDEICFLSAVGNNKGTLLALPHLAGGLANGFDGGRHGRALATAAHEIIKHAKPMISSGRATAEGFVISQDGTPIILPPTSVAMIAIVASIAIPNLMESKITANESAAAATLKSAMAASQITFQAGCYQDADGNGVGEYGFIEQLNGEAPTTGTNIGDLNILMGNSYRDQMGRNGYRYEVYLPDGKGGALKFEDGNPKTPEGIAAAERQFLIYAWPIERNETGRRVFVMTQDCQIRSPNVLINIGPDGPAWNAAFGGGDAKWGDEIVWPFYR